MSNLRMFLACMLLGVVPSIAAQQTRSPGEAEAVNEISGGESLTGAFLQLPRGEGPFPAVIVLGGSEGGDSTAREKAPLFLKEGYAVLGLPYYSPAYPGRAPQFAELPRAFHDIPIDRLETARDWLRAHPQVDEDAIGIYGVSKGAEFALAGASLIDGFHAVAAIVPSDVIWEAWGPATVGGESSGFSWRGEPLPFVPYIGMNEEIAKFARPGETPRLRTPHDAGRHANPHAVPAARIRVEQIGAPVLVAGGDADSIWASGEMAQSIAERRSEAGLDTVCWCSPKPVTVCRELASRTRKGAFSTTMPTWLRSPRSGQPRASSLPST
ncbi:dienelactone hydrolase family protein [Luteimonas sp. BDR2-5]|uniref:acyl-CoA thioester hydrolase/BAAT C-terminal domain-containing protein n=1 Tax=Proluteimonas luteida TaxID=2878685 RepID=UPI001E597225|nr:acyl-CoA thioester hydrolase/BAAT C-terminal domain-containing protein [Luteimonas sp. BDR2-5]MCD9026723.1 dienelactone hydrolase family protein [Luteimonas sp. BDR2-5]